METITIYVWLDFSHLFVYSSIHPSTYSYLYSYCRYEQSESEMEVLLSKSHLRDTFRKEEAADNERLISERDNGVLCKRCECFPAFVMG